MKRNQRSVKPLLLLLVLALVAPRSSEARCNTDLASAWRLADRAAPVFRGTVRIVAKVAGGQVATFEVDRVWRGRVPARIFVYNHTGEVGSSGRESVMSTAQSLTVGERYVIFARDPTAKERQLIATTTAGQIHATEGCSIWLADQQEVKVLGKGRDPEPSTSPR